MYTKIISKFYNGFQFQAFVFAILNLADSAMVNTNCVLDCR